MPGYTDISVTTGSSGHPYETVTTLRKHLNLELEGEILDGGDHVFV